MHSQHVYFVVADHERLIGKQGLDIVEQGQLLFDGVVAQLTDVQNKQHDGFQMSQGRDGLHLDCVALFQRVVQYSGSVDNLDREKEFLEP